MYRKGVSALIVNSNQEFLLVNLQSFEERYFAIPGGGVDEGETLEDAVYREILEELSLKKESLQFIGVSSIPVRFTFKKIKLERDGKNYIGSDRTFFGFAFLGNDSDITLQEDEVRSYKWVPFKDLGNYLLFDNQLEETCEKINELFSFIK